MTCSTECARRRSLASDMQQQQQQQQQQQPETAAADVTVSRSDVTDDERHCDVISGDAENWCDVTVKVEMEPSEVEVSWSQSPQLLAVDSTDKVMSIVIIKT